MKLLSFHQKKSANVLPFSKKRKWGRANSTLIPPRQTQRLAIRHQSQQPKPVFWKRIFLTPLKFITLIGSLAFVVTTSLFQWMLRMVYGGIILIGLTLLAFAGILALFAGGKVPTNFWASLWHGESVLFMLVLAGISVDAALIFLQIFIGANQTSKRHTA